MANLIRQECGKSELNYQEPLFYQTDIEDDYFQYLSPKNTLTAGNPIYFDIEGTSDFIDISQTQLKVRIQVTGPDGANITEDNNLAPINNVLNSLFSQVQISLKGNCISHSNLMYPFKSYIENLLHYPYNAKFSWMKNMGWIDDQSNKYDLPTNTGLTSRRKAILNGRTAEYMGRLNLDIGFQDKLLPSNIDIRISLTQSKPDFFLINHVEGDFPCKVKIIDAALRIRRVKLTPEKQLSFEQDIAKKPVHIPMSFVVMKNISISSAVQSFNQDGLFTGPLPTLVIVGLCSNKGFVGYKDKNPFNFQHFGLNSICLRLNGKSIPSRALTPNFDDGHVVECYQTLYEALNRQFSTFDNGIDISRYIGGCALYAFNLTPDQCAGGNPLKTGSVDISLRFKNPLAETVSLVVYSQFENSILIDQHRNCITDIHI